MPRACGILRHIDHVSGGGAEDTQAEARGVRHAPAQPVGGCGTPPLRDNLTAEKVAAPPAVRRTGVERGAGVAIADLTPVCRPGASDVSALELAATGSSAVS